MPSIHESIVINRPWTPFWLSRPNRQTFPRYSTSIVKYELLDDGPLGLGSQVQGSIKVAGKRIDFVEEIVSSTRPVDSPSERSSHHFRSGSPCSNET